MKHHIGEREITGKWYSQEPRRPTLANIINEDFNPRWLILPLLMI
jgi:hypothetical protein